MRFQVLINHIFSILKSFSLSRYAPLTIFRHSVSYVRIKKTCLQYATEARGQMFHSMEGSKISPSLLTRPIICINRGGRFSCSLYPTKAFDIVNFAEWQCERCSKLLSVNTLKSSYSLSVTMLPRIFIHAHFYQEPANRGADVGQLNCHSPLQDISMPISRVEVVRKHCCRPLTRQRALSLEASVCSLLSKSLS